MDSIKPNCVKDLLGNKTSINNIIKWVKKKDKKGCLLISGDVGMGKTAIIETILKEYKFDKIELQIDVMTPKKINEFFFKTNGYVNINNYFKKNVEYIDIPKIYFIDNIDLANKQTIKELINILKNKFNEKLICITNNKTDSKIKTLANQKNVDTILIKKTSTNTLVNFCNKHFEKELVGTNEETLIKLIERCRYDIRKIIISIKFINGESDEQFKIYDSVKEVLSNKNLNINRLEKMYQHDVYLIPYFIHQNYLGVGANLKMICKSANNFSDYDVVSKNFFDNGMNVNNSIESVYCCAMPNYYINKKELKKKWFNVSFPLLLNRKSQSSKNLKNEYMLQ